ncbi:hypothetical protein EKO04_005394 [Ascochyta lentis]|uniref:Uncharacterized protein n=1 Tax=Ascochyta lentis TaxID=205686 RepID=A0A8H7J293_9PLEO|nr:hypothetical protein EKO04_005394 [Ascochyta lentis]
MLPCYNWEYSGGNSTAAAIKFATCQECQMKSGWQKTGKDSDIDYDEKDSTWFLFNNKGVVDWCLFGRFADEQNKNITSSSINQRCSDSCSKIRSSIDYNIKSDPGSFDFCEHNTNGNFTSDAESCATCLYANKDLTILGNVLTTVQDMCEKKPGKNYTVPANVSVYSAERIQLSATSASTSPTSSSTSLPLSDSSLPKGVIAGIVLGALVAIILVLGGILLLLRRKKNRSKTADVSKGEETAAQTVLQPDYYYNAMPVAGKDRFSYAAEAPVGQAPVEIGIGQGLSELPTTSTPPVTRS